ncbi:MAG: ABC transporter permease [Planctomycetota bacterium]
MVCLAVLALYFLIGLLDFIPGGSIRVEGQVDREMTLLDRIFWRPPEREYDEASGRYIDKPYVHPSLNRPLGTDIQGDDVLWKTLKACRTALTIALLTSAIAIPLAVLFGMLAGYFGGIIDDLVQYIYQTLSCIPGLLLLLVLMVVMGKGIVQLCIALGVTSWVGLCRLVRAEVLKHRESDYVQAARALGAGHLRIMFLHILPNVGHLVVISFTLRFGGLILSETFLSYIGMGVKEDSYSWGQMISQARLELVREPMVWWNLVGATVAIFFIVLASNIFGDALRDALDPKLRD